MNCMQAQYVLVSVTSQQHTAMFPVRSLQGKVSVQLKLRYAHIACNRHPENTRIFTVTPVKLETVQGHRIGEIQSTFDRYDRDSCK